MGRRTLREGFTLMELIVVIVIVGILAALAAPIYTKTKEKALDREAVSALKLIQAAEKIYRMEQGFYFPCVDNSYPNCYTTSAPTASVDNINTYLHLYLRNQNQNWNYSVTPSTSPNNLATPSPDTTGGALRNKTGGRYFNLTVTSQSEPPCTNGASDNCL